MAKEKEGVPSSIVTSLYIIVGALIVWLIMSNRPPSESGSNTGLDVWDDDATAAGPTYSTFYGTGGQVLSNIPFYDASQYSRDSNPIHMRVM